MEERKKVLIITYYWPPSGGSGVQRWMYFCKYFPEFGIEPYVVTVDEHKASYKFIDKSFSERVANVKVYKTDTLEPFNLYSRIIGGERSQNIPQGFAGESKPNIVQKLGRFVRGNFFLPDARRGWNRFAFKKAKEIIRLEKIDTVVTVGPPHSTHLIGLKLKKELNIKWIADFRDPWTEVYYNRFLYRTKAATARDLKMETEVLKNATLVTTVGPSMKRLLGKKITGSKDKVAYIYNGYDDELLSSIKPNKDSSFFTITHIGLLGDSQPITSFLNVLKSFFDNKADISRHIRLKLIGKVSPSHVEEVKRVVPGLRLETEEYVPHRTAIQYMADADLLFNSIAEMEGSEILISGKMMEYIASGNPILALGNAKGDAAELMNGLGHAVVLERSDLEGISSFLEKIYLHWKEKKEFEKAEVKQFSRRETARQMAQLIMNAGE